MKVNPTLLLIAVCIALLATAGEVVAQTTSDLGNIRDFIDRNAELLQRAREFVGETSSIKARQSLDAAVKLHQESVRLLSSVTSDRDFSRVASVAKKAREVILQTIALAKREAKLEESAIKAIERAANRLEQARRLQNESDSPDNAVKRLVEESHNQLARSRRSLSEHLFEVSLRLAVSSEEFSTRAIRLMKRDSSDAGLVEREILKTERLLRRVRNQIGDDSSPQAQRMYDEGRVLQEGAKQNYRSNHSRAAVELTQQARKLAMRAAKINGAEANTDNVRQALRLTDTLVREAVEVVREKSADQLDGQIDRARKLQSDAKRNFESGNFDQALRMTLRVRIILKDALSSIKTDLSRDDVVPALRGTDKLLARLNDALDDTDNAVAQELHERAKSKQRQARQELNNGRYRAALTNTRLARKLVNRAFRKIGYEDF